jgi:hypothetical protein
MRQKHSEEIIRAINLKQSYQRPITKVKTYINKVIKNKKFQEDLEKLVLEVKKINSEINLESFDFFDNFLGKNEKRITDKVDRFLEKQRLLKTWRIVLLEIIYQGSPSYKNDPIGPVLNVRHQEEDDDNQFILTIHKDLSQDDLKKLLPKIYKDADKKRSIIRKSKDLRNRRICDLYKKGNSYEKIALMIEKEGFQKEIFQDAIRKVIDRTCR